MVEPRKEVRAWRAWGCWALACQSLPDFPSDELQLMREGIVEPEIGAIFSGLESAGVPGEAELWHSVLQREA